MVMLNFTAHQKLKMVKFWKQWNKRYYFIFKCLVTRKLSFDWQYKFSNFGRKFPNPKSPGTIPKVLWKIPSTLHWDVACQVDETFCSIVVLTLGEFYCQSSEEIQSPSLRPVTRRSVQSYLWCSLPLTLWSTQ